MFITSRISCLLTLAAVFLFPSNVLAENGVLVVHVVDIHGNPQSGVSLRAGAGSSVTRVDSFGQARIQLPPNAKPGESVYLELVSPPHDLVFVSPLNHWTAIPSFDEKSMSFVEVVLVRRGDRAMLENHDAGKAMANDLIQKPSGKISDGHDALREVAQKYGRAPEEVDLAIRNLANDSSDSFAKGLSELYAQQYPQAERDLRDALRREENVEKVARIKVAERAALLGRALREQGKYADAIEAYKEAVDHNPSNGTYVFGLATTLLDNNEPKKAEQFSAVALTLDKQRLSDDDPDLAYSYFKAGTIFVNQGKYAQAEPYFLEATHVIERGLGRDSPQLVRYLDNLAMLYSAQGKKADWESLLKRAYEIQEHSLDPDDPENVYTQNKLAEFYVNERRLLDADKLLKKSAALLSAYFQKNMNQVLPREFGDLVVQTDCAFVLERRFRGFANKEDESLLQEALMFQRSLTGEHSVETAHQHEMLADLLREQGRYGDAETNYREALETWKSQVLPVTVNLRAKLSLDLAAEGKHLEAEGEGEASLRAVRASPNAGSLIFSASNFLAELYAYEHKPIEARKVLEAALSQPYVPNAPIEPERIESVNRLAGNLIDNGKFDRARNLLGAMRSRLAIRGPSESGVILAENIAVADVKQKMCAQATVVLEHAATEAGKLKKNRQAVLEDVIEKMVPKDVECGNLKAAEADVERGLNIDKSSEGNRKQFQVRMLGHLADVYSLGGKFERRAHTQRHSLSPVPHKMLQERMLPTSSPTKRRCTSNGSVTNKLGRAVLMLSRSLMTPSGRQTRE